MYLTYFTLAFAATVVGTIPFGPINLSVVNVAMKRSFTAALVFALGAAFVEIFEALTAIFFGNLIDKFLMENAWFQWLVIIAFVAIGTVTILRKPKTKGVKTKKMKMPTLLKGVVVALLNPQAIPFWLITLAVLNEGQELNFREGRLGFFLAGVFAGKFVALAGFAVLSRAIKKRVKEGTRIIDFVFGGVLIAIGLIQAYKTIAEL